MPSRSVTDQPVVGVIATSAGGVEHPRVKLVVPLMSPGCRVGVTLTPTAGNRLRGAASTSAWGAIEVSLTDEYSVRTYARSRSRDWGITGAAVTATPSANSAPEDPTPQVPDQEAGPVPS